MTESDRVVCCGAFVREARLRHGMDQADLARRLGTSQAAISRIERDLVSPKLETLERILNALGETLRLSTLSLSDSPPEGGNQSIFELRADYKLSAEERLAQTAQLSEMATQLASEADLG
jgi:transcriptional regulator with XRE-family HTH domain